MTFLRVSRQLFQPKTVIPSALLGFCRDDYVLFSPDGVPLRAKLSVTLKEYRPAAVQFRESPTLSPDFDKSFVVRRGDTLSGIAGQIYRDPARWREIARANGIVDPRRIRPGDALRLPKLR